MRMLCNCPTGLVWILAPGDTARCLPWALKGRSAGSSRSAGTCQSSSSAASPAMAGNGSGTALFAPPHFARHANGRSGRPTRPHQARKHLRLAAHPHRPAVRRSPAAVQPIWDRHSRWPPGPAMSGQRHGNPVSHLALWAAHIPIRILALPPELRHDVTGGSCRTSSTSSSTG